MLTNDRKIQVSSAGSRKATSWPTQTLYWSELVERLKTPVRSVETLTEYLSLSKSKQDDLKDVGGFVAGTLEGNRRKAGNVIGRDVLALDLDSIQPGQTSNILQRLEGLGCAYVVYSTRKHYEAKPRLRVLIPLDATCDADEYEPLARKMGSIIGIDLCDPTTFEASRLMYWPSCSSDSVYIYNYSDKPFASKDGLLATYTDWKNILEWPQVPGAQQVYTKLAAKQGDPTEKEGIVGAFCKTYDIYRAIDTFLLGEYTGGDDMPGRLTFTGGSTTGGAVVYDNGNFLYSHHATDPAGGKLCNAFDLVRLHRFNGLDDDAKLETPINKLPSYTAMCKLVVSDTYVATLLNQERYEKATQEFSGRVEDNANWISKLENNVAGFPVKTMDNVIVVLENDPLLVGKIAFDEFANRGVVLGALPWDTREEIRAWGNNDDGGLTHYLEKTQRITLADKKINYATSLCAHKNSFDDVKKYVKSLTWDGVPRLDMLFIEYLGAADTPYTRAITRKSFTAAVARAMVPGTKFDNMIILTGKQGAGKSTLLKKMGRSWFSDSIKTFEGKEASELLQGVWLVEIGELEAFNRSETGRIKQFLSQCEDIFRAAYGRHTQWCPRRCIFFGTSNNGEYLRDKTGNRRFWPLDISITPPIKNVHTDLDQKVDQLWAEAFVRWQAGEPLHLTGTIEQAAIEQQEYHREADVKEGIVREFIERKVPLDWNKRTPNERKLYWSSEFGKVEGETVERDKVCALEVLHECLGCETKWVKQTDTRAINDILRYTHGWGEIRTTFGPYSYQRGFRRI